MLAEEISAIWHHLQQTLWVEGLFLCSTMAASLSCDYLVFYFKFASQMLNKNGNPLFTGNLKLNESFGLKDCQYV